MDALQNAPSLGKVSSVTAPSDLSGKRTGRPTPRPLPFSMRQHQPQSTTDLLGTVAEVVERAKRKANREPLPGAPLSRHLVQLPLWPDTVRAVPNGFLRSALFGAFKKDKKEPSRYLHRELVAALNGLEIRYTGERLDQGDLNAYQSVLHAVRLQALGEPCQVTSYALLKFMGLTDTGKNRDTLHDRITRLRANAIEFRQDQYTYIGGLIDEASRDTKTKRWVIVLNPRLGALFAGDQFTQIDWAVRSSLSGHPIAQWLHGFYASHAKPYDMYVRTLHKLCGSEAARMDHFRDSLRDALSAVAAASHAHGQPFSYEIRRSGLVKVEKTPTKAQRRHLQKKATKARTNDV